MKGGEKVLAQKLTTKPTKQGTPRHIWLQYNPKTGDVEKVHVPAAGRRPAWAKKAITLAEQRILVRQFEDWKSYGKLSNVLIEE